MFHTLEQLWEGGFDTDHDGWLWIRGVLAAHEVPRPELLSCDDNTPDDLFVSPPSIIRFTGCDIILCSRVCDM